MCFRWYNVTLTSSVLELTPAQVIHARWAMLAIPGIVIPEAGAYTRPLLSSTLAVLVTPPRDPLSNRLGGNHAPNVSHKMCLR
jgi:hypothetical protein